MHLLNILSRQKVKIIILVLAIVTFVLCVYPLIIFGRSGIFFTIDPDAVYVANVLSNIKAGVVSYYDHPGTPAISLMSLLLLPLRLITKFVIHQNFIDWTYFNLDFVFYYIRIFQAFVMAFGVFLFIHSIYLLTKSITLIFISFTTLLSFLPIYYAGVSISPEALSIFLSSLWLYILVDLLKRKSNFKLVMLSTISGLIFANRATGIIYPLASLIFLYTNKKIKYSLFIVMGFIFGLMPLHSQITTAIKRILFFAGSSGIHGYGAGKLIDIRDYINSFLTFLDRDMIFVILIFVVGISSLINLIKNDESKAIWIIGLVTSVTSLVFMKFPLAHYQTSNYILLVFIFSLVLSKINFRFQFLTLLLFAYAMTSTYYLYFSQVYKASENSANIEKFVDSNPSDNFTKWEWARSKEFARIWVNDWGGGLYKEHLKNIKCWNRYYIQKISLDNFILKNQNQKFAVEPIFGVSDIVLVEPEFFKGKPSYFCEE